jgi:RepB DNA-primase from phage plasmid
MCDRGLFVTLQAIRRQLMAMPHEIYLIRLIHQFTRQPFPGERLWTASQLTEAATVRFLRVRNREGCDIYIQPYAEHRNAGYILVDLDAADPAVIDTMRANGHDPCVVVQTSPGHLQAWIRISTSPVEPAVATAVGRHLARTYGGDRASTDWRHLGRLAGFTNQKPQRRSGAGYAPWVRILHARAGLAPGTQALIEAALQRPASTTWPTERISWDQLPADAIEPDATPHRLTTDEAAQLYRDCLRRWHILERFPQPDWSIVDLWVARELLRQGRTAAATGTVLRLASPHFPRDHGNPEDYLRRTLARAAFPAPGGVVCAPPGHAPLTRPRTDDQPPIPSRKQALILADQMLNRLVGYARKGTRARRDSYQNDLNWLADVCLRLQAGEPDPLRPTGE